MPPIPARRRGRIVTGLLSFTCLLPGADPAPVDAQPGFFQRTGSDLWHVVSGPAWWDGTQWSMAGGCVVATTATALFLDQPFRGESQETRNLKRDRSSFLVGQLGTGFSLAALGSAGLHGWVADDPRGIHAMVDGVEASIIASAVITPALKFALGRARPNAVGQDADVFEPFSGNQSFPSGHATQAFAVASVVARSYADQPLIGATAFVLAIGVGASRINDDAHYASDVVAGAVIGTYVGWTVSGLNAQRRVTSSPMPELSLTLGRDQQAIAVGWRF